MSVRQRLSPARGNWHRIYYLLALFDVLTVASGLFLTHRITVIFQDAVAVNQAWAHRLDAYSALGTLASEVNAPGNDVFDTAAVDIEERRLAQALEAFNRATGVARREAENSLTGAERTLILADLDAIATENEQMVAEARSIFGYFRAGQPVLAGRRMATMDRRYAELNAAMARLRRDAIASASVALDGQEAEAAALRAYEVVIGVAILLMVAAATMYGNVISRRITADAAEREAILHKLRETEKGLEQRVIDRTEALSTANEELARLAAIVTASEDAIVSVDTGGRVLTWNPAAERLFGYSAEEIVGQPKMLVVPEDFQESHRNLFAHAMLGESFSHHRTARRRKDGVVIPVDLTVSPLRDQSGQVQGALQIVRDVSAQVRAESMLAETTQRLVDAQRMAQLGSWEFDLATQAVRWSDEMFRLFGLEPGEVEPSYEMALGFIHPEGQGAVESSIAHSIETGQPFDRDDRVVRRDGTEHILRATGGPVLDTEGRTVRIAGTAQDVTELRAAEAAVKRSEERFRMAARATNDALWDWDVVNNAVWWNEGFRTLFAHRDPTPTLEFWMSLIHPDDAARVGASIHAFLESASEVWTGEYRFKRADGNYAWVLDRGFAIRDGAGHATRMIGSMMDITDRKESERMKSDFVSFVSHQLLTPLSGMSWMLELAADTEGLPEDAKAHIADARESGARLSTLVNDLLDIAKLESGRLSAVPEALSLSSLTQSVVAGMQLLVAGKALNLDVACDPSARPVFADSQLLRQVVTNLLSNAVRYTPPGGRIDVLLREHNESVTWAVRDTGVGVPTGGQGRLFEKFYRADNAVSMDAEGTGLGLHLVRLIVEQAGGRVWCESEEGHGAMFAFTLPAMAAEKEAV